jgi:CheY-like chemotaxis protein
MSTEVRRRAFEPFFTTKGVKRTGLGLAVAYGTIHRHGGQITVDSAPGEGTTVTFWIPAGAVTAGAADDGRINRGGSVLVIDDEADVRELVAEVLASHGHRVTTAAGGVEGVERFKEGQYDLVITDLGLPDLNGWDVARAIKICRATVPVLLLTGWEDNMSPTAATLVDGIIKKPFGVLEIPDRVHAVLAR